jgi:hypothetical protein
MLQSTSRAHDLREIVRALEQLVRAVLVEWPCRVERVGEQIRRVVVFEPVAIGRQAWCRMGVLATSGT